MEINCSKKMIYHFLMSDIACSANCMKSTVLDFLILNYFFISIYFYSFLSSFNRLHNRNTVNDLVLIINF